MSEKWWTAGHLVVSSKTVDTNEGKKFVTVCEAFTFQYAEDIANDHNRLHVAQEPCEWERDMPRGLTIVVDSNLQFLKIQGHKFCPNCGRRLEEK